MMRWLFASALLAASSATAAEKPLFAGDDMLRLSLRGPIAALGGKRAREGGSHAATLVVAGATAETLPVALSVRGITRRRADTCQFPPLRLEFAQKPPQSSLFRGQKRLKLVTHCRLAEGFQRHLLLEYAAYRLFNRLTPTSFRARLASIDYVDDGGVPTRSRLGFLIEDVDDLARRNGLREAKVGDRVQSAQLSAEHAARVAVFQYAIGNLDWATTAGPKGAGCCHNSRLLGGDAAASGFVPVPYDFDFSGIVDAPYAVPPDIVKVRSVRTRRYRGHCRHNDAAQAAAADLFARRASLLAVFDELPQLDEGERRKATAYLSSAFDDIATPQAVTDKLLRTCLD